METRERRTPGGDRRAESRQSAVSGRTCVCKKVQSCADIARRDREMAEADTSGRSEEKREKQVKFPVFYGVQTEDILEENGKAEQQPVKQSEQKTEKKTSLLRKLDEKKKECAERDAKQQAVKKKRNHEMSL